MVHPSAKCRGMRGEAAYVCQEIEDSGVRRICLTSSDLKRLISIRREFRLDFDDAYQYIAAEKDGLVLVSFDAGLRSDRSWTEDACGDHGGRENCLGITALVMVPL